MRQDLAATLTNVIQKVINENNEAPLNNLLIFPYTTLRIPSKDENVTNLTSFVRQNIRSWNTNEINIIENITYEKIKFIKKLKSLRLLSSDDCIAPKSEETLNSLIEKHPIHPELQN